MNRSPMTSAHQDRAGDWILTPARAERIAAAPLGRWLAVAEGRVWLTRTGAGPFDADLWVEAGERVPLPAGSEWVIEGWPAARVQLLEERPARRRRGPAWWRPLADGLFSGRGLRPGLQV
jgi:hypothetical protein